MDHKTIEQVLKLNNQLKHEKKENIYSRDIIEQMLKSKDRTLIGLVGARGTGKTTILKTTLKKTRFKLLHFLRYT